MLLEASEETIQAEEGKVLEPVEGDLEISFHAIAGTPSSNTLWLVCQIAIESVVFLLILEAPTIF